MIGCMPLSISEVARQIGLRPSAIRYYEQIGIFPSAQRRSGQRRYDRDSSASLDRDSEGEADWLHAGRD